MKHIFDTIIILEVKLNSIMNNNLYKVEKHFFEEREYTTFIVLKKN